MRKALFVAVLALLAVLPVRAQYSNITTIQLLNNNNTVAQSFQGPFDIKVGAACTWSVSGTIATFNCAGGGGGSPASPDGSLQYNNAGSFGAIAGWANGKADCDGGGDPCDVFVTSTSTFKYFLSGTNSNGTMGNNFDCYQYTDAGVYCNATDGTGNASMNFSPTDDNTGMSYFNGAKATGLSLSASDRVVDIGRMAFSSTYTTTISSGAFSLGAGWGSTASVTAQAGTDNAFSLTVTTGGSGIAANPTVTFTYVDGDFSGSSSSAPVYVCSQAGGNDVLADVTNTAAQTSVALTWHGTPTTAKTYTLSCVGFQRN